MLRRTLGVFYAAVGLLLLLGGLLLAGGTAFGEEDQAGVDPYVALWSPDFPDLVWYAAAAWLALSGALVIIGAYRGLRRRTPARRLVLLGLLLVGVPLAPVGIGVFFLAIALTLLLWRPLRDCTASRG